jgi:hypothetical protein
VLLAAVVAACAPTAPAAGKPTPVASVCDQPDGSRVRLDGYLRYRRGLLSFCHERNGATTDCDLALYADAARPADFDVLAPPPAGPDPVQAALTLKIGKSPSQMEDIPERFSAADIKVHLDGGSVAGDGGHVVVDGKLSVIPQSPGQAGPKQCYVTVDWAKPAP